MHNIFQPKYNNKTILYGKNKNVATEDSFNILQQKINLLSKNESIKLLLDTKKKLAQYENNIVYN